MEPNCFTVSSSDFPIQVWDFLRNHETHLNYNFCSSWILQYITYRTDIEHGFFFSVTYRGKKKCRFLFFVVVVVGVFFLFFFFLQSALRDVTWTIRALSTIFFHSIAERFKTSNYYYSLKKKKEKKEKSLKCCTYI